MDGARSARLSLSRIRSAGELCPTGAVGLSQEVHGDLDQAIDFVT
jgi:hypothetical protein